MGDDRVLVVTTGGTIDKVYFDALSDYEVGESVVADLLKESRVTVAVDIINLLRKDSLELDDADRALIRETVAARPEPRVVVTHGTDTMTQTAAELADLGKTVVLTGSLSPARFARSDATFNVGMAFAAVQTLPPGAYICMNGEVFDVVRERVRKDRARNAFVRE